MEPEFLEKAVLRLLVAMGYGGSEGDAQHIGGPGDGGFDGVINQDRLGLERIYVQAKRYKSDNKVGRPDVQGFVGALHGMGAAGGVFITTSDFTPDAAAFARDIKPRVILINGQRLGALMVAHGIGVQATQLYRIVEVDEDFFE
jgi:restriction system protein